MVRGKGRKQRVNKGREKERKQREQDGRKKGMFTIRAAGKIGSCVGSRGMN